jgi:hypothetical protein
MPGYDSKKSKFGSRKPRNTDKLSKEEQKKIEERNKKRGLTKAQAQNKGLTGQKSRDAAVKLRANRATQKTAVAKEAKRKAAEKKKMKAVSKVGLAAGSVGGGIGAGVAKTAAKQITRKATQKITKPKTVKRITDKRTRGEKQAAIRKDIANLKAKGKIGNKKNVRADENPNLTPAERRGGETFKKGGEIVKPAVGRIRNSKLERNILAGRPPLDEQDLKQVAEIRKNRAKEVAERRKNRAKQVAEIRKNRAKEVAERRKNRAKGLKAGGLIKKKGIDGIAKRGKTRATRSI